MFYRIAADLLVVFHALFILFVVLGGLLIFRWRWLIAIHLPAAAWAVLLEFKGWVCPLTPWEQGLRRAAGEVGYRGGFIEHYFIPLIYPSGLTPLIQFAIGLFVLSINAILYGNLFRRRR